VSYKYDSQNKRVFADAQYQNHPCLTLPTVRSTLATVQAHEETVAKVSDRWQSYGLLVD